MPALRAVIEMFSEPLVTDLKAHSLSMLLAFILHVYVVLASGYDPDSYTH